MPETHCRLEDAALGGELDFAVRVSRDAQKPPQRRQLLGLCVCKGKQRTESAQTNSAQSHADIICAVWTANGSTGGWYTKIQA